MYIVNLLKKYDFLSALILILFSTFLLFEIRLTDYSDASTGETSIGPKTAPTTLNITIIILSLLLIFTIFFKVNKINENNEIKFLFIGKKIFLCLTAFFYLFLTEYVGYIISTFVVIPIILHIF